jgi:hypothetical protein
MSSSEAPALPSVTFEVERFEWASDGRLEVVGRWFGLRGHRFLRPTLDVEVAGERRRMLADLEHKPWAAEDGEQWAAAFAWRGERVSLDEAELTVSPDLAVQLPPPDGSAGDAGAETTALAAGARRPARRPRAAVLEGELATALAEVARLTEELAKTRDTHSEAARELRERARLAQEETKRFELELESAAGRLATAEAHTQDRLEELRRERDDATAAREAAGVDAAAARAERDAALRKLAELERERDALAEARDRAREERNAWMSRARASAAELSRGGALAARVPAPESGPPPTQRMTPPPERTDPRGERHAPPAERDAPPPERHAPPAEGDAAPAERDAAPEQRDAPSPLSERRTIQIGARPGPLRPEPPEGGAWPSRRTWTPRLIAIVALIAFVVIVLLLLLLAF